MSYGLISLAMLVAWIVFGPPVGRQSFSASNNGFMVKIAPRETIEADGQSYEGILAQERGEWKLSWICGGLLALPVLLFLPEAYLIAAALGHAIARLATNHFDMVGHNIEIMVAEEEGLDGYREAEIGRMITRDPSRKGMTSGQVDGKLKRWEWLARIVRRLV